MYLLAITCHKYSSKYSKAYITNRLVLRKNYKLSIAVGPTELKFIAHFIDIYLFYQLLFNN